MVCRILVADDSSTIQKVIKIGLASLPNDIRSVSSLADALRAALPGQLELIIVGAGLPGVSAAGDFKKLSEQAGGIPMIVLIGSYDAVREVDLRSAGINNIMKKPFPPGDLTKMVQELVGGRRPSDALGRFDSHLQEKAQQTSAPVKTETHSNRIPDPPLASFEQAQIAKSIPEAIPQTFPYGSISSFDLGQDAGTPMIPPIPEVEPARKGRPAFDLGQQEEKIETSTQAFPSKVSPPNPENSFRAPPVQMSSSQVSGMSAAIEAFVRNELPGLVDRAVERYCIENFKQIAKEALTAELRRLAEEKARFLVDQ